MSAFVLRCRVCESHFEPAPLAGCPECDGPLDAAYDWERRRVDRELVAARPADMWRYRELLPHAGGPGPGWTPLVPHAGLSEQLGVDVALKLESGNPTGSFKDRLAASAVAAAQAFGLSTVTCAPGGRLGQAVAAHAGARGLRAVVVARGPGSVDRELAPFAVEGAKTVAFEIVEQLGWRFPDVVVAPLATGALLAKLAQGFAEAGLLGLANGPAPRLIGAQAGGSAALASAFAEQSHASTPGRPAIGDLALGAARMTGGAIRAVRDTAARSLAALLGDCIRDGLVERGAQVVLVVSGTAAATAAGSRHAAALAARLN